MTREQRQPSPEESGRRFFNNSPDPLAVVASALSNAFSERSRQASSAAAQTVSNIDRVLASDPGTPKPPHKSRDQEELALPDVPLQRRKGKLAARAIDATS